MKRVRWNENKNQQLIKDRNISFQDVMVAIESGKLLDTVKHKTRPTQKIFIIEFNSYAYDVPFVEDEKKVFLKTIYPNRKHAKKYLHK